MAALALFMWQIRAISPSHPADWLSLRGIPFSSGQAPSGPQLTAPWEASPQVGQQVSSVEAMCFSAVFRAEAKVCPLCHLASPRATVVLWVVLSEVGMFLSKGLLWPSTGCGLRLVHFMKFYLMKSKNAAWLLGVLVFSPVPGFCGPLAVG